MKSLKWLLTVALIGATSFFTGCASFSRIANYPTPQKEAAVNVAIVPKPMSKMSELPIGVYYDPQRQIIVSGHQKGAGFSMLFGIVGVLVADQMNQSAGKDKYGGDTGSSTVDLGTLTQETIQRLTAEGKAAHWKVTDEKSSYLRLSPYALFTIHKDTGAARLYAMLRAEIIGADGKPTWSARYFARAPGEREVGGAEGWMAQGRFAEGMKTALTRVLEVCAADTQGQLTDGRKITAKGRYPYLDMDLPLRGIVVQETPDYLVARMIIGDAMVLAGTHVLDRADFEIKDADFKDPRK